MLKIAYMLCLGPAWTPLNWAGADIPSANIPNCVTLIRHDLAKVATHAFVIDGGRVRPPRVYPNDL